MVVHHTSRFSRRTLVGAALVGAVVLPGLGGAHAASAPGPSITIVLGSEPTTLDPHLADDGGERAVNDNVYETLLVRTPDGELAPGLAAALPTAVDDLTWEFTLREGVTFHNGEPFDAAAVVASVERIVGQMEAATTTNVSFFAPLTGAEAVDDHTVRITTAEPDAALPARMYWLKMVAPSAAEIEDLSDEPNGTGPYRFVDWTLGQSVTLEANPDYWGGAPAIGEVRFDFIGDSSTRVAALMSGAADLITNLSPDDAGAAPQVVSVQGQEHPILILDADDGITADPNVRLALNLAVDKQALVDNVYGGYAVIDNGQLLSPWILGHNPDLEPFAYDPDEAARLIDEAGLTGTTIQLVGEEGRWLKDREVLEAIAGYWSAAGLDVQLDILEFGAYLDVLFDRETRPDAVFVSSSNDLSDADRQLANEYEAGGIEASNSDAELAALIAQARTELDPEAREALYQEAVALARDNVYFVFLVNNSDIYGLSERIVWQPRSDAKLIVAEMSVAD